MVFACWRELTSDRFIPLIAIITPGTLSVVRATITSPTSLTVLQREYGRSSYAAAVQADNGTVFYGGATSYLKGPTLAMLVETQVLSIGTYSSNLTWSMDFHGPALSCSKASPESTQEVTTTIKEYQTNKSTSLMYDVWIPKPSVTTNRGLADGLLVVDPDSNSDLRILDQTSTDAAKIYYSIAPSSATQANISQPVYLISCALYNASWHVDFDVRQAGEQYFTRNLNFLNWMPGWSSITPPLTPGTQTNTILDYAGLMETFGAITSGQLNYPDDPALPFTQTSLALETSPILFDAALPDPFTNDSMINLQRTLEDLFQNMTLSTRYAILPRQDLRGDSSDWISTTVTAVSTSFHNIYSYTQRDLLLAYSLAILSSAICILLAVFAIRDMKAVYSDTFSTIVRIGRNQDRLDSVIRDDHDRSGAEPLRGDVANAYIWVGREQEVGMGIEKGRMGSSDSLAQGDLRRSWWGREQVMDLEKVQDGGGDGRDKEKEKGPIVVIGGKKLKGGSGPMGGWI
jgi:hypothetical protein